MYLVTYYKKGRFFEEYLDLKYCFKDKKRFSYLCGLENFYHINDLQKERLDFYD